MSVVKISWSGGKDSTASVLLHLFRGDECKVVCYIPYFDDYIPLIRRSHYEYILSTKKYFENLGASVYIVRGISYFDWCTHISLKGKHKGKMFGFPCPHNGKCGFKRDSKIKALNAFDVGYYDYESIGIACDEVKRFGSLSFNKRSIFCELGYTELDCYNLCYSYGVLSPIYSCSTGRDGCCLCYNAKKTELLGWLDDYNCRDKLICLQDIVKLNRPDREPLRGHNYFL